MIYFALPAPASEQQVALFEGRTDGHVDQADGDDRDDTVDQCGDSVEFGQGSCEIRGKTDDIFFDQEAHERIGKDIEEDACGGAENAGEQLFGAILLFSQVEDFFSDEADDQTKEKLENKCRGR